MLRFLLRSLGFVLVAVAFAALVVDGSRSIAGGRILFFGLGDAAAWLGGPRVGTALASAGGWPGPAGSVVDGLIALPAFAVTGAIGLLLLVAGRPAVARISGRRA